MKKNKFAVIALIFIVIFLIQPQNREQLTTVFTQHDIKEQLAFTDSPEEKNFATKDQNQKQNTALKKKFLTNNK